LSPDAPDRAVVEVVDPSDADVDADVLERVPDVVVVVDFGRVVVVVEEDDERLVVVVVDDFVVPLAVVVVVDDFVVEPFAVVVVVDGRAVAGLDSFVAALTVVVVVDARGTLGSSLAGDSSRAWAGAPGAAGGGGDPGGGGIRSSRRAYCMIREKTGAETWPP
jgi:uncharacterized membrane protein YgcG